MEEIEEYRHDLWNEVLELARDRDIYDQEAFFETACETLRDSEASPHTTPPTVVTPWARPNPWPSMDTIRTLSNWMNPSWLLSAMTD